MSVVKPQFLIGAAASGSVKTTFTMCRICFLLWPGLKCKGNSGPKRNG